MQTTTRKDCPHAWDSRGGYWHTREATGRATRCRYCSAVLLARSGWWGVFPWVGGPRGYWKEDAVRLFRSQSAAEKWADRQASEHSPMYAAAGPGGLVVRWVDA